MEKLFVQNRKGQKVSVIVEQPQASAKGLAFVMHGLGGFKEQPHIQVMAEAFLENGYTTVRFDATNSFGESEGKYEDATTTNYFEDLEDVIAWSKKQPWYEEPFCLAGHSLGAISTALYAEKFPNLVKALAPISTVVSGELSISTERYKNVLEAWERTGWKEDPSESKPGLIKRLKWNHIVDRLKYDLLPQAKKLTMPILLIVGSEDNTTPAVHQQLLFKVIPGPKEIHIIEGSQHTFRKPDHLQQLKHLFDQWIKKLG